MGRTPRTPPPLPGPRPGLVWPAAIDSSGELGPTKKQAAGRHWRLTSTGLYLPVSVSPDPVDQRIVEVAAALSNHAFLTGWAALRWHGATWFDGTRRDGRPRDIWVDVWNGGMRERAGLRVTEEGLDHDWIGQLDGVRLVSPAFAVMVEMRFARNLREAVIALDMAAYADLVSIDEVAALVHRLNARTGIPQGRAAVPLANENAWSPQEVRTRLGWELDAGLPPLLTNRPLFDRQGRHIGTPDLLEPEAGVVIEYDGADHLDRERRFSDVQREERFRDHGLEYLCVQADDMASQAALDARMRRIYGHAQRSRPQSWTTTPPYWWTPTHTVELRRALRPEQRDKLLGYRKSA
jgi:hypothetical protein